MKASKLGVSLVGAVASLAGPALAMGDPPQDGKALYAANCLECHMAGGGGVPFMQPPLKGSAFVLGDAEVLIDFVLWGTAGREGWYSEYQNAMPSFEHLSDDDLAAVLSYVRGAFGNEAGSVSPSEITTVRKTTIAEDG